MVAANSSLSFPFCHAPGGVIHPPVGARASQSVVPAGRRAPPGSLSPTKAGRHRDLLPAPFTLRLGSEGTLGGGRQHAARVLGDDHEPPECHNRAAPHETALAHRLLLTG